MALLLGALGAWGAQAWAADGPPRSGPPDPPGPPAGSPPLPSWLQSCAQPEAPIGPDELRVRWWGTAAFELRTAHARIWIDPYVSRTPLWPLLTQAARSDAAAVRAHAAPAAWVAITHAHFDHFLDAPSMAKASGARLAASAPALAIARGEGLPSSQGQALRPGLRFGAGGIELEAIESRHSDMITQRLAGGGLPEAPRVPLHFLDYKNGPTFAFLIRWRGRTLLHLGSADFLDATLQGQPVDLAMVCVSGWSATPDVYQRLAQATQPKAWWPMHDDDFFQPFGAGFVENPLAKRAGAIAAMQAAAPQAAFAIPRWCGAFSLRPAVVEPAR